MSAHGAHQLQKIFGTIVVEIFSTAVYVGCVLIVTPRETPAFEKINSLVAWFESSVRVVAVKWK